METAKPFSIPKTSRKNQGRLTDAHRKVAVDMTADGYSGHEIAAALASVESTVKYGLMPIYVTESTIRKAMARYGRDKIAARRAERMASLDDMPCTQKRVRIQMLWDIAQDSRTNAHTKVAALKGIKEEIGEDVDKLADAIKSGGTSVAVSVAVNADPVATDADVEVERINAARLYQRVGRASDN